MGWTRRLRNREDRRPSREKAECDLPRGCTVRSGNIRQHVCFRILPTGEIAVTERAAGRHRNAVLLAPGNNGMLDGTSPQIVKDLIAGKRYIIVDRSQILEILHVEVADAPGQYLAGAPQNFEGRDSLLQRMGPAPMQKITVEMIGAEPGQRPFASCQCPDA